MSANPAAPSASRPALHRFARALALVVSGAAGLGLGTVVLYLDAPPPAAEPPMHVVIGPIRVRPASRHPQEQAWNLSELPWTDLVGG